MESWSAHLDSWVWFSYMISKQPFVTILNISSFRIHWVLLIYSIPPHLDNKCFCKSSPISGRDGGIFLLRVLQKFRKPVSYVPQSAIKWRPWALASCIARYCTPPAFQFGCLSVTKYDIFIPYTGCECVDEGVVDRWGSCGWHYRASNRQGKGIPRGHTVLLRTCEEKNKNKNKVQVAASSLQ